MFVMVGGNLTFIFISCKTVEMFKKGHKCSVPGTHYLHLNQQVDNRILYPISQTTFGTD